MRLGREASSDMRLSRDLSGTEVAGGVGRDSNVPTLPWNTF